MPSHPEERSLADVINGQLSEMYIEGAKNMQRSPQLTTGFKAPGQETLGDVVRDPSQAQVNGLVSGILSALTYRGDSTAEGAGIAALTGLHSVGKTRQNDFERQVAAQEQRQKTIRERIEDLRSEREAERGEREFGALQANRKTENDLAANKFLEAKRATGVAEGIDLREINVKESAELRALSAKDNVSVLNPDGSLATPATRDERGNIWAFDQNGEQVNLLGAIQDGNLTVVDDYRPEVGETKSFINPSTGEMVDLQERNGVFSRGGEAASPSELGLIPADSGTVLKVRENLSARDSAAFDSTTETSTLMSIINDPALTRVTGRLGGRVVRGAISGFGAGKGQEELLKRMNSFSIDEVLGEFKKLGGSDTNNERVFLQKGKPTPADDEVVWYGYMVNKVLPAAHRSLSKGRGKEFADNYVREQLSSVPKAALEYISPGSVVSEFSGSLETEEEEIRNRYR
jgi:hypothetical protein